MKFNVKTITLFWIVAMLFVTSCGDGIDHGGKTPLVGIGDEFLHKEDMQLLFSSNRIQKEDSADFVRDYVEHWLEDMLLYKHAKRNVSSSKEINRLIENYKRALLLNVYQERLVAQSLDKEIASEEILSFYERNKSMFKMEEPMVKGLLLKVSKKAPKLESVKKWCKNATNEDLEKLEKYTLSNALVFEYFYDKWTPLSLIAAKLPFSKEELNQRVRNVKMLEFSDSVSLYMMNVADYLPVGELKPLDLAETEIKELLVNSRKAEFLQNVKRNIYNEALEKGEVKFYDEKLLQ